MLTCSLYIVWYRQFEAPRILNEETSSRFIQVLELVNYYLCSESEEQGMVTDSEENAILLLDDTLSAEEENAILLLDDTLSAEELLSDEEDETQSTFEDETLSATELAAAEDETLTAVEDDASNTEE